MRKSPHQDMRLGRTPLPAATGPQPLALCASEGGIKLGVAYSHTDFVSRGDNVPPRSHRNTQNLFIR